jgi:processive 1,2-diacylglycerol beta-glucosyltransferase
MDTLDKTLPMKIIIFYSSIGHGHISAARAIEREILQKDSSVIIVLKDIREFMSPLWRKIDERLYWFVLNNLPESFNALFWSMQETGTKAYSIATLPNDYPDKDVLEFISLENPEVIVATHYGSAQVLARLRECEQLKTIKIGWLHTDFFEGYFPRISMRLDCTFLGHSELSSNWIKAGVPEDLIKVSGMPVDTVLTDYSKDDIFTQYNLNTSLQTVLIAGGKEGLCDYQGVISKLSNDYDKPLQVLALCGMNTRKQKAVERQSQSIQSPILIHAIGFVPHHDLIALMHSADILVTKAGGLTPSEAFTIGLPTVLLDVIRGHEHENATLFVKLGVALLALNSLEAGTMVMQLLHNESSRQQMIQKQKLFSENSNFSAIANFALDQSVLPRQVPIHFGAEHGLAPQGIQDVLNQLDSEKPIDFELLLSYATSQKPERIAMENPFGHIAIRIGSTVFSANHLAENSTGAPLLQKIKLDQYLFGIVPPPGNQEHTNSYGMAYGRDTLGLRIKGVNEDSLIAMLSETEKIEEEYRAGTSKWNLRDFNCAHVVVRILSNGGFQLTKKIGVRGSYAMPLDVFNSALSLFQGDETVQVNLVAYKKMIGSQANYRYTHFPLTMSQPLRSLKNVLHETSSDKLEESIMMQVANFGDDRLFIENLTKDSSKKGLEYNKRKRLKQALHADASQLLEIITKLEAQKIKDVVDTAIIHESLTLIHKANDFARQATELADEILIKRSSQQIRDIFSNLVKIYGNLNETKPITGEIKSYIQFLEKFHDRLISEIQKKSVRLKNEIKKEKYKKP